MNLGKSEKHIYEELKERLSKVCRTIKNLEARTAKNPFSSFQGYKDFLKTCMNWKQSKHDDDNGLKRLERTVVILGEIQNQKNTWGIKIECSAKGKKRKTHKSIHFDKLTTEISSYKNAITQLSEKIAHCDETLNQGHRYLSEGRLHGNKAEKIRQELDAVNSRFNVLRVNVSNICRSLEAFVLEMQFEYSKGSIWLENSADLDSWLVEYETCVKQPEKLGTTIRAVRYQLHDNQKICEDVRSVRGKFENMSSTADELTRNGRLDEPCVEEIERIRSELLTRWVSLNSELTVQRNRIYAELNKLRKRTLKRKSSIIRRFSSRRSSARKRVSLRRKRRAAAQQASQAKVSSSGNVKPPTSEEKQSPTTAVKSIASVEKRLLPPNKKSEQHEVRLEQNAFRYFDFSFKTCEERVHNLDEESLHNFSAVGQSVEEVKKQLHDIKRFEEKLESSKSGFEAEISKYDKAKSESLFTEAERESLEQTVSNLKSRLDELQQELTANKQRIIQALLTFGDCWMKKISKDLDEVEKRANLTESHLADPPSMALNIREKQHLLKQLDSSDAQLRTVSDAVDDVVHNNVLDEETASTIQNQTQALRERLTLLKSSCRENEDRLSVSLLEHNQMTPVICRKEEETVKVSEDYFVLSSSPHEILSDEGFVELDHFKIRSGSLGRNEEKMKQINKIGQEITREAPDMYTVESVENEKRLHETNQMLDHSSDKNDASASTTYDCGCSKIFNRMFHACFYS